MGLPAYAQFLANLRGPQGVPGRPGTFTSASAVSVPAGQPAEAIISGVDGEIVQFKIPQGLPGVNAVPADAAVGGYVGSAGSATRTAVSAAVNSDGAAAMSNTSSALSQASQGLFPVYRIWTGSSYPPRVPGAVNVFFGPTDPGLLMAETDYWASPDTSTLAEVVSAASDPSSALFSAIRSAAASAPTIPLNLRPLDGSGVTQRALGSSPSRLVGWKCPPAVVTDFFATAYVPLDWTDVTMKVRFAVPSGSGNLRLVFQLMPTTDGEVPTGVQYSTTVSTGAAMTTKVSASSGSFPLTPGGGISVAFSRLGTSGLDTYTDDVVLLAAWLERK